MLDTHPDREPTLGKGEDLGISQLGSFNRGRHWDSGSILGHSSAEEGYPEDLYGWSMGLDNMLNN